MTKRLLTLLLAAAAACTDVSTDPDGVASLRFEGSAYPSIVAGDSLRDSLGLLQPLQVTALNADGDPIPGAPAVFSSPDTIVQVMSDGVVFARGRKADGNPVRVFARVGSLQSQPDTLFVVPRADSIDATKDAETVLVGASGGASGPDSIAFFVFGDTVPDAPAPAIRSWLVSFQLKYHGELLPPTDTTVAYTFEAAGNPPRRFVRPVDTTDAQGKAARRVFVRSIPAAISEDTIYLVATIRTRTAGAPPISAETMILLRRQ